MDDLPAGEHAQLAPDLMKSRRRLGTDQPAQAAIEDIRSAIPSRAQTAGVGVHFQDLRPVTVHLQVAATGQAGDTATDDDDFIADGSGRRRSRRIAVSARNVHP